MDLALAASAKLVSIVALAIAVRRGQTIDPMAEANARRVAANSWPFLQYSTGDRSDDGKPLIRLPVINAGIGPARVESLEVFWNDAPGAGPDRGTAKACWVAASCAPATRRRCARCRPAPTPPTSSSGSIARGCT